MSHVDDGTLHAYLDGELPAVEQARVEAHVADCPACRARLEEERALIERASHLLGLAQPPERAAPPLHQLRQPRLIWRLRFPLAWAASLVLAVGLGYYAAGAGRTYSSFESLATSDSTAASNVLGYRDRALGTPAESKGPQREAERQRARAADANQVDELALASKTRALAEAAPSVSNAQPAVREEQQVADSAARAPVAAAPAAPRPNPSANLDAAVVTGAAAQPGAAEWPIIEREPARRLLGADPVGVPGLPVRTIRRSPSGDGVVVVEQQVDSATVIQLFQQRVATQEGVLVRGAAPAAAQGAFKREALARFVGSLRVEITGRLAVDSLNKLLEQARPIP
jgi:hypothetical protein